MINVKKAAAEADMIVNGYAFKKCSLGYRILNLHNPKKAVVISQKGEPLETTMDDIEISIVTEIFNKDKKYLEEDYAEAL